MKTTTVMLPLQHTSPKKLPTGNLAAQHLGTLRAPQQHNHHTRPNPDAELHTNTHTISLSALRAKYSKA